jgi:acetyltransferase-like isoleucine patch superfamily enzyme
VVLGDDVIIGAHTDIYTHSKEALVTIGDRVFLNGTRFDVPPDVIVGGNPMRVLGTVPQTTPGAPDPGGGQDADDPGRGAGVS